MESDTDGVAEVIIIIKSVDEDNAKKAMDTLLIKEVRMVNWLYKLIKKDIMYLGFRTKITDDLVEGINIGGGQEEEGPEMKKERSS